MTEDIELLFVISDIMCSLFASCIFIWTNKDDEMMMISVWLSTVISYKITVETGDAGNTDETEPSVYVTLYGTRGDSGPRLLFITNDLLPKFQPLQVSTVQWQSHPPGNWEVSLWNPAIFL